MIDIGIAIVGHEDRRRQVHKLEHQVSPDVVAIDDGSRGEWKNHALAWGQLFDQGFSHGVVLQDDALPIEGFRTHADWAVRARPENCISFYVGTGYPIQLRNVVPAKVQEAEEDGVSWLTSRNLYWGVGVGLPLRLVPGLLGAYNGKAYDEYIGAYCARQGVAVSYTWPSLVDHADGPSLVKHWDGLPRTHARRACRAGHQLDPNDSRSIRI